jgi:hypothetical protein
MAVAVVMDFKGATLEQYDQVMERMGLAHPTDMPGGEIAHWVTATDDGIRVTDVWDSREQFERFGQEQIGPSTQAVGITEPPEITFYDVHNWMIRDTIGSGSLSA